MKRLIIATTLLSVFSCKTPNSGDGTKLKAEGAGLQYNSYRVLFTNPTCKEYKYTTPVKKAQGTGTLKAKPKNVFCAPTDSAASGANPWSPQKALVEWINGANEEIFLAFLSFSNKPVSKALCEAANRGVKVTFVLDAESEQSAALQQCGTGNNKPQILLRGHVGGIGYAHNKIVLIDPGKEEEFQKVLFGSGNMSSGIVTHHENWHFVEVLKESYFAQNHYCLMNAVISEEGSSSKAKYKAALKSCRSQIQYEEETDIKSFFIPNADDSKKAVDTLVRHVEKANRIDMGAHRFAFTALMEALETKLQEDASVKIRLVADDDIYWNKDGEQVGDNTADETNNVRNLEQAGGGRFEARFMETNHGAHMLHHNKFLIFDMPGSQKDAVLYGAANLTGTGFFTNFENIYFTTIPEVVDAFKQQYERFWNGGQLTQDQVAPKATEQKNMPFKNILPPT